ncbi:MAG TPA: hypothetical protein PLP48_02755 [Acholeplasmataceae bacterium]|nr:hypothetical protein [Acholeplasmataceae bacterium]
MNYRLRLKIKEYEIEVEGSEEFIQSEKKYFFEKVLQIDSSDKQSNYAHNDQVDGVVGNPIKETMITFDPNRDNLITYTNKFGTPNDLDFVLIAARYDEIKNNNSSFDNKKIINWYDDARRKKYSNYSVLITKLIKKGMIMSVNSIESGNSKSYRLTSDGIKYIENYQLNQKKSS